MTEREQNPAYSLIQSKLARIELVLTEKGLLEASARLRIGSPNASTYDEYLYISYKTNQFAEAISKLINLTDSELEWDLDRALALGLQWARGQKDSDTLKQQQFFQKLSDLKREAEVESYDDVLSVLTQAVDTYKSNRIAPPENHTEPDEERS